METYKVKTVDKSLSGTVVVPGSKSMTNRALLLAALSEEEAILQGVLFSDDSRHFLDCLVTLGYKLDINETEKTVKLQGCGRNIPNKFAKINVGSAGTAARFITAMLALSDGGYEIGCSEQMEKRPMEELFKVLTDMGAQFTYLKEEGHLPVRVKGNGGICKDINMDISKSTQFLSAMLMVTPVTDSGICIRITSEKKEGSYIHITMKMLQSFGVDVKFDGECYTVPGKQKLQIGTYYIEPDVSAACYFYGMAALTGGKVIVKNVHSDSMQGDLKFLSVLEKMGCEKTEEQDGIAIQGPQDVKLKGVDINMNDFSDQALTLAALAPFADSETVIRNIGHIRGQECNRMAAIVNELKKCGIGCWEDGDDIHIEPGEIAPAVIETYEDHRVAMAFTLLGLKANGIVISNPMCCKKTFETYYKVLEQFIAGESKSE
ncbi:3-phosphoshikimate 1-carboxyvinyltransferase [Clostridium sp. CAG:411]|jgi:3-phosphoshikimate 1-carboxyvinyltransferase|nr:3-phosphoshikimate 1-carboxyvinyltransferase [Lachnospiraceae bacterium]CDE42155.1 3-phosphoshikimate 1-carboxyvinyltransferase [Clostridium sp. CAG:411]